MKVKTEEAPIIGMIKSENNDFGENLYVSKRTEDDTDMVIFPFHVCFMRSLCTKEKFIYAMIWTDQIFDKQPYFCQSIEYISSWCGTKRKQTSRYIKRLLDNGHIRRVDGIPNAYTIVEDDPDLLEALEFMKDPQKDIERFKAERAAKKSQKATATSQ